MGINLLGDLGYDESSVEVKNARAAARMYADVIDELVKCRSEAGLSQIEVAESMRTSQSTVSEFESANADARFSTLVRYAQSVGCDMVIEITQPGRRERNDWVHVTVKDEGIVVPFVTSRVVKESSQDYAHITRNSSSHFSEYLVAEAR